MFGWHLGQLPCVGETQNCPQSRERKAAPGIPDPGAASFRAVCQSVLLDGKQLLQKR